MSNTKKTTRRQYLRTLSVDQIGLLTQVILVDCTMGGGAVSLALWATANVNMRF